MADHQFTEDDIKSIRKARTMWTSRLGLNLLCGFAVTRLLIINGHLGFIGHLPLWYIAAFGGLYKTTKPLQVKENLLTNTPDGWYQNYSDKELIEKYYNQMMVVPSVTGTDSKSLRKDDEDIRLYSFLSGASLIMANGMAYVLLVDKLASIRGKKKNKLHFMFPLTFLVGATTTLIALRLTSGDADRIRIKAEISECHKEPNV